MNRTFCTSACLGHVSVSFFLSQRTLLALALFHLSSVMLSKEFNRLAFVDSVFLSDLGTLPAFPRDSVAWSAQSNINVHTKNSNIRVVLCARDVNVLMYSDRDIAKVIKR